jgi:cyclophilin family peptidyl-prolyl cis-trans isomerase
MIRLFAVCLVALAVGGCVTRQAKVHSTSPEDGLFAEITTPRGLLTCELYFEKMPLTVASFVGLAEGTLGPAPRKPFFDGLKFHRVVPEFVIQGGDPTGTGRGGPGYRFPDEFAAGLRHEKPGVLSMANNGPDTNGSQFFITLGEARYLDFVHAIFGRVIRGQEQLDAIQPGDEFSVKIVRRGRAAQNFRTDETTFNQMLARASRTPIPFFVDRSGSSAGGEHWQSKYIENRLANLARFTGRQIYVRLLPRLESDPPEQTAAQHAAKMAAELQLSPSAILACYFAEDDQWALAGAGANLTLPELEPTPARGTGSATEAARQKQNRIYTSTGKIISSLTDQTDRP